MSSSPAPVRIHTLCPRPGQKVGASTVDPIPEPAVCRAFTGRPQTFQLARGEPALVIAARDIDRDRTVAVEMAPGKPPLDRRLAVEQPVHGGVEIVAVAGLDPEFAGQGGVVPEPGRGELGGRL